MSGTAHRFGSKAISGNHVGKVDERTGNSHAMYCSQSTSNSLNLILALAEAQSGLSSCRDERSNMQNGHQYQQSDSNTILTTNCGIRISGLKSERKLRMSGLCRIMERLVSSCSASKRATIDEDRFEVKIVREETGRKRSVRIQ